jgi:hypothetical protein
MSDDRVINNTYDQKVTCIYIYMNNIYYLHAEGFGTIGDSFVSPSNRIFQWQLFRVGFQADKSRSSDRSGEDPGRHLQTN